MIKINISIFLLFPVLYSQAFHKDFFEYMVQETKHDFGYDWEYLSNFGVKNYNLHYEKSKSDKVYYNSSVGIFLNNNKIHLTGYKYLKFKNSFYLFTHPRHRDESEKPYLENFSGFGFKNTWFGLEFCSGNENWGSGEGIELGLSKKSDPYNYLKINSDYGKLRVIFIFGKLEALKNDFNRYIVGRGIEWTNKKSLILSASESIIYSGYKRGFDISYFNMMNTHLEVEMNKRQNVFLDDGANAIWQLSIDWLLKKKLRFSGNFLIDDLTFDKIEKEKGKENGIGYSGRLSYSNNIFNHNFSFYYSYMLIGTPTLRHGNGYNNFVQNKRPIGSENGSDFYKNEFGFKYFSYKNQEYSVYMNTVSIGVESLLNRPYAPYHDYIGGPFPSGGVVKERTIGLNLKINLESFLVKTEIIVTEKDGTIITSSLSSIYYEFNNIK